jgi:hypothetical protein
VAVIADVLLRSTEVGERLHVAGLLALVGAVTEQVRSTVPVNELAGVTEMVEVLLVVAPGLTVMLALLLREKLVLPLGASQKPLHPVRSDTVARKSPANPARLILALLNLARLIPAPWGLDCGPNSPVPTSNSTVPILGVAATRDSYRANQA